MTTYIVFLKNLQTGEEFTVPTTMNQANQHDLAMMQVQKTYPANRFLAHTAYTTQELDNIIVNATRWPGAASKVQKGTVQTPKQKVAKPLKADSIFAAGSMIKQKPTPQAQPKKVEAKPATPAQPQATVAATAAAKATEGMSVIERLKMMKN